MMKSSRVTLLLVGFCLLSCRAETNNSILPPLHSTGPQHSTGEHQDDLVEILDRLELLQKVTSAADVGTLQMALPGSRFQEQFEESQFRIQAYPFSYQEVFYQEVLDLLLESSDRHEDLMFVYNKYLEEGGSEAIHIAYALDYLEEFEYPRSELKAFAKQSLKNIELYRNSRYGYHFAQAVNYIKSI